MKYITSDEVTECRETKTIDITDVQKIELSTQDVVIVILDDKTNDRLGDYYRAVKYLISKGIRVIAIMVKEDSKIRKQMCMLMALYQKYDMYCVDSLGELNDELIRGIEKREPTQEEVEMFISNEVVSYDKMSELLSQIVQCIDNNDKDAIIESVYSYRNILSDYVNVIDYTKKVIDNTTSTVDLKLKEMRGKINEADSALAKMKAELGVKDTKIREVTIERDNIEKEADRIRQKCRGYEQSIERMNTVITTYNKLDTGLIQCKAKRILYFKEISSINYISSFVHFYKEVLTVVNKLNVKLLIYDNKSPFNNIYKPIDTVDGREFMANKTLYTKQKQEMVIVEPNQMILEEILKESCDVAIIYDRLRQKEDIVVGNCVYKYYVIKSKNDIANMSNVYDIDKSRIFTAEGTDSECIELRKMEKYGETHTRNLTDWARYTLPNRKNSVMKMLNIEMNIE